MDDTAYTMFAGFKENLGEYEALKKIAMRFNSFFHPACVDSDAQLEERPRPVSPLIGVTLVLALRIDGRARDRAAHACHHSSVAAATWGGEQWRQPCSATWASGTIWAVAAKRWAWRGAWHARAGATQQQRT